MNELNTVCVIATFQNPSKDSWDVREDQLPLSSAYKCKLMFPFQ